MSAEKDPANVSRFGLGEVRRRILSVPTLVAIIFAAGAVGLVLWRVLDFEWEEFWRNVTGLNLWYFLLAAVLYYASFWFRGVRWRSIFITSESKTSSETDIVETRSPTSLTMAGMILSGWFVNSVMFFRLGDAYRGWALADRSGGHTSTALGTVFAERVQDMVVVLVLVLVSVTWALVVDGFEASGAIVDAAIIVIAIAAGLVLLLLLMLGLMGTVGDRLASWMPSRLSRQYVRFQSGALASFEGRHLPYQIVLGVIGWILEIARFYFVAEAMGLEMALSIAMFAALANAILTTVPIPGGLGIVETALIGVLLLTGLNDTDAFTLTVLDRMISWLSVVVLGGIVFVLLSMKRGERRRTDAETDVQGVG